MITRSTALPRRRAFTSLPLPQIAPSGGCCYDAAVLVTAKNAGKWLKKAQIATLTPTAGVPSLVEAVAGEPIGGSWWGHPSGKAIYAAALALEESGEALVTKLVEGKVTFVHADLWPALHRIVTDPATQRKFPLDATARSLLEQVQKFPTGLRLDPVPDAAQRKARSKAVKALEAGLWVHGVQIHGERGHHETTLMTWQAWSTPRLRKDAAALEPQRARALLREALGEARTGLVL